MDPIRTQARHVMNVVRDHEKKRHRQYTEPPHHHWGCDPDCLPKTEHSIEALALAIQVGGVVVTPQGTYAPGWMRPA